MQISAVDKTKFTSVVPMRVYINGKPSADAANIRRATRLLTKVLKGPSGDNEHARHIVKTYAKYDKDYDYRSGCLGYNSPTGSLFRNYIDRTQAYFLTGKQAMEIEALGRKIGPAKSDGLYRLGSTKTFESKSRINDYYDRIKYFIQNPVLRIRENISPTTNAYEGKPLTLNIYTVSDGNYGKKGFQLLLDDIDFSK